VKTPDKAQETEDTPVIVPSDDPGSERKKQSADEIAKLDSDLTIQAAIDEPTQNEADDITAKSPEDIVLPPVSVSKEPHHSSFRPELIFPSALRRKLGSKARLASIIVIVLIVCIGGGLGTWALTGMHVHQTKQTTKAFSLTITPFKLVSTVPAENATNVNTSSDVTLNFSQPVKPNRLINNMFLTPKVTGTYAQGSNKDQVIFKPAVPFSQGTKVTVMINGTVQSARGSKLGAAHEYSFSTSIPDNEVIFQDQGGLYDQVTSLASGQKEAYSLQLGSSIGAGAAVTLYKGTVGDLLHSLVYANTTTDGVTTPSFSDLSVSTSGLQAISKQPNITNNETYNVQEPDGLYVAVATNATGKEVGFVWVDFSKFGVLIRQDDQKAVLDAQLFSNAQDVAANVKFYNLNDSVNLLGQHTVDGLTTANYPYSPSLDLAVATYGQETDIIPVNILDSGGDIRVDQNLSSAQQVYGVTDKPTYSIGSTLHYAGFVRNDNDAQYTNPGSGKVNLYIAQYAGATPLASFSVPIDANGMFSGSVTVQSSWLNSGDAFDQLQIFAAAVDGNNNNDLPVAGFSVTNQSNPSSNIEVHFSQSSYVQGNQVTASITATNGSGQPLANATVEVHIFSQDYYENDPVSDLAEYGSAGTELPSSPVTVQLNSNGQATYTLSPTLLPNDGNSQLVTIQANLPNQSGVGAAGGNSTIIHQGDGTLTFGFGRQQIPSGDDLVGRVYANHLNGSAMANSTINYQLMDNMNSSTLTSGSTTTDANGYAVIDIPSSKLSSSDGMELTVTTTDESGNIIQAVNYYSVTDDETYDTSGAELQDLDVSGSSGNVHVGDTVNLTITAPANMRAMVTMDRGRIYNPSMLNLNKGANSYSFTVTSDLAPSFTLTFNYFLNGVYHSEGVSFDVDESSQSVNVGLTPAAQNVAANQPTSVQVATTDNSGNPLATTMVAEVVSSNAYGLSSQTAPDIFEALYNPRPMMTSSSSSLSPIGSGGSRCGGGGGDLPSFANALATTLYWQPELITDSSGNATINFTPPSGSWTINVYAMSGNTQVGHKSITINAQ